jgi:hypothetical protein
MKNSVLTLTESHVRDSKEYINGNVAEHLINEMQSENNGYFFFLTNDEIELFEKNAEKRHELIQEIENFIIENFNYEII